MIPNKDKLVDFITKANDKIWLKYAEGISKLEYAIYEPNDINEFKSYIDKFNEHFEVLEESKVDGKKLLLFKIKSSIKFKDKLELDKIGLIEPDKNDKKNSGRWISITYSISDEQNATKKYLDISLPKIEINSINKPLFDMGNKCEKGCKFKKLYEEEKEKRLYALAQIDNEKKRMERQRSQFVELTNVAIIKDLFDVADDLNRIISNEKDTKIVKMVYNKLLGILNNYGVVPCDINLNDNFDPDKMEAITTTDSGIDKKNKIIHIEQLGFVQKSSGKVLRSCRVIVGK